MKRNRLGRDPFDDLAAVAKPLPPKRNSRLGADPLAHIGEDVARRDSLKLLGVRVPERLLAELRGAAHWTRRSLADLVREGLERELQRLRDAENEGAPFEPRGRA